MISHKHKCIFVHIPKAAGTSIEMVFLENLGLDMKNRHSLLLGENTNKSQGPRRISHLIAKDYVNHHYISEELFQEYFKFSFVRNPYDRLFSTYKFLGFSDYMSFDTFILKKLDYLINSVDFGFFLKSQYDYLYQTNKCLVDFVGKFENLNSDFNTVCKYLGNENLQLKHYNKTKRPNNAFRKIKILGKAICDYKSVENIRFSQDKKMSTKGRDKVLEHYSKDFQTFSYSDEICLI